MTPKRWQRVKELFRSALEHKTEERGAFLDRACEGDDALRREVETLLASFEESDSIIETPVAQAAAELVRGDQTESLVGRQLGHYKIIDLLGEGGMGAVYLARDTKLGRKVALKLLPTYLMSNANRLRRFEQEACAASALNHPNILTIYEIGETNGRHFIATEFIEGETLRERLAGSPMKLGEVLNVAAQIAGALSAAHAAGIMHRDVKPENVMLRHDGIVKVLDFGLAKLTAKTSSDSIDSEAPTRAHVRTDPGVVMGTAIYMSPEQARGLAVDVRTDIWSLGVVLYEMVAGCLPFAGATTSDVLATILNEKEPPPLARFARDVPHDLEHIVSKALRKDRDERYQNVKDMLIDLRDLKRDLELQVQLERSTPPQSREALVSATKGSQTSAATVGASAAPTAGAIAPPTSSAEYIVNSIKLHKRAVALGAALVVLVAIIAGLLIHFRRAPALTDKDTILLADFVNTTGDAAFDGTLKQALAIQLEQSPFLNVFPEERVRETLRLMSRPADERVTKEVAREICQRQGLKAYLAGSISGLGSHYVVTLEAVNAYTGETLGRQQVEAESKEKVLGAVGQVTTKLREKLGESLASIQKYDAAIDVATTSSLEALKAYSMGRELHYKGKELESIPLIKRAIEIDPNFARAYDGLAWSYANLGQHQLAKEAMQKAFELRDRTSEYEKLKIAADYYWLVTRDLEKAIEALELVTRTYPRDFNAHNNLTVRYNAIGRYEQAIEEAREAVRLNPNSSFGYGNLALAFRCLNRFDEAKAIYEQALAQKLDTTGYHTGLYTIAFVRGDTAAMQQQLDWARGKPNEYEALFWQANTASYQGQLRRARDLNQRGADEEVSRNLKENAGDTLSLNASTAAAVGNCQQAREEVARASALPRTVYSFSRMGIALALCGELGQAHSLADEYAKQYPKETLANAIWLPTIRAAIEIHRNNPAQAIQLLQSANRYDRTGDFWPEYLRGQAYLAQGAGTEAAAEFQKILDRRGLAPTSVLYPLAHLGLARAAALQGDSAKARKAYQDFFALWKDADPDIPILIEAKKEYEKLK